MAKDKVVIEKCHCFANKKGFKDTEDLKFKDVYELNSVYLNLLYAVTTQFGDKREFQTLSAYWEKN